MVPPSMADDDAALEAARKLTPDQVHRGLFPKSFADLQYRATVFAVIARGDADYKRKATKKKK